MGTARRKGERMPDEQLTLILKLRDEATAQMKTARAGIIAAGAAIAAAGFSAGKKWEDATKTIIDGTGATGDALKGLQGDYQAVAKYGDGAAKAIADLNTHLGLQGEELQLVAEKALKMSADTNAVGESLGHIVSQGGDATAFLDVFHAALQSSGVEADRMQRQLNKAIPRFAAYGFSAEETAAHVIELANANGHEGLIPALALSEQALRAGGEVLGDYSALALESAGSIERSYEAASSWRRSLQEAKDALIAYIGPAGDLAGAAGATASGLALAGPQMYRWIKALSLATVGSKVAAAALWLWKGAVAAVTTTLGAIIIVLVAVGAAFYVFQDQIGDALRRAEQSAKDFYLGVKEWLSDKLGPIFDKVIRSAEVMAKVLFRNEITSWLYLTRDAAKEAADETEALAAEAEKLAAEAEASALALKKFNEEQAAAAKEAREARADITALTESIEAFGREVGVVVDAPLSLGDYIREASEAFAADLALDASAALEAYGESLGDIPEPVAEAAASTAKLDVTLAALAGGLGGASGQAINLFQAMRETNATLEEGEEGFSKAQMGAALAAGVLKDLAGEFGGVAGQALEAASSIAQGFATGGPVGAALAAASVAVQTLMGLFSASAAELAARKSFAEFHKGAVESLGKTHRFAAEVQRGIAAGWDSTLAETRAAFILWGTDAGRTYDQAFNDYARYEEAVRTGNTALMAQIESEYAEYRAMSEAAAAAWESAAQAAVSAFQAAQDAGQDAYDTTLAAAIKSGLGQEEAVAQATAAQIAESAKVLAVKGREYARIAAFEAAMALGANATAEERNAAARAAAQVAIDSWGAASEAVVASDQAATDAMLGNHTTLTDQVVDDAGRMVSGIESHLSSLASKDWQIDLDYSQHGAPPRQHGGPVSAGRPYKVGEVGEEIFVPSQSGSVVPNKSIPTAEEIGAAVAAAMQRAPLVVPQDPVTDAIYRNGPRRAALRGLTG